MNRFFTLCLFIMSSTHIYCGEQNKQLHTDFYTVWLPGLHHGHGADSSLLTTNKYKIYDVIAPASQADLGQSECIRDFDRQLTTDSLYQASSKTILIGSSQGAATVLNKVAQMSHAEQKAKIAALVLEAPLADANEAILQSASKKPSTAYAPFLRFWSPWVAKKRHPHYNPYGIQAIASAKYIAPEIPIVILHNKRDTIVPVTSSRSLVAEFLKSRQNYPNNVYYIESDIQAQHGDGHTNFLSEDAQSRSAFHRILKKLDLPYLADKITDDNTSLSLFQPSVEQLEQANTKDTWKRKLMYNTIDGFTLIGLAALLYWRKTKRNKKYSCNLSKKRICLFISLLVSCLLIAQSYCTHKIVYLISPPPFTISSFFTHDAS